MSWMQSTISQSKNCAAELLKLAERDIVMRALLRGKLAIERERQQERRAAQIEARVAAH